MFFKATNLVVGSSNLSGRASQTLEKSITCIESLVVVSNPIFCHL